MKNSKEGNENKKSLEKYNNGQFPATKTIQIYRCLSLPLKKKTLKKTLQQTIHNNTARNKGNPIPSLFITLLKQSSPEIRTHRQSSIKLIHPRRPPIPQPQRSKLSSFSEFEKLAKTSPLISFEFERKFNIPPR